MKKDNKELIKGTFWLLVIVPAMIFLVFYFLFWVSGIPNWEVPTIIAGATMLGILLVAGES